MDLKKIRKTFTDYFVHNGHTHVQSSPLVPHNDPSMMFTNSGMVQFKNYFTGSELPKYSRATSAQKCVRAGGKHNDLENVGYTARHHTFFEMLGNFSFGDYFKDDAIAFSWDLVTNVLGVDKKRLYITTFHEDEEAQLIWKKITGFDDSRIIKIATKDNFWSMGDTGPCGPCSEIFYDHGEHIFGGLPGTKDEDGDRFVEIWNLVFMQYEDLADGKRIALPKPSIDTGMGLERISAVLQGVHNNYDIDLFQDLINASKNITGNDDKENSHRIIADHIRSISFLIADGVMPSNEGRGYVLRRVMRRAMRHIHALGYKDLMLSKLLPTLINAMGDVYPELVRARSAIESILDFEESKFKDTLDKGMKILSENTASMEQGDTLLGDVAFKLYDTYGFPIDLTEDILRTQDLKLDHTGFEGAMQKQKELARASWVGSGDAAESKIWFEISDKFGATEFVGYSSLKSLGNIVAIVKDGVQVFDAKASEKVWIVLNQTPFYAESGGQVGDVGMLGNSKVTDTKKFAGGVFAHLVELSENIKVGDNIKGEVNEDLRLKTKANHSATHLLHKALRDVLGMHVTQKGSLVGPNRLRFDFSHNKPLTREEIYKIEQAVNSDIIANHGIGTVLKTPEEAIKEGAMALFGEKYGAEVRVVSMGESIELCGGTHVGATGDIGAFKIVSESSIASGVRRIEAATGLAVIEYLEELEDNALKLAALLKCNMNDISARVEQLTIDKKQLEKEKLEMKAKILAAEISDSILEAGESDTSVFKLAADIFFAKNAKVKNLFVLNDIAGKLGISIFSHASEADKIARDLQEKFGGKGGGRGDMAQIGGLESQDKDKIREYLNVFKDSQEEPRYARH